MHAGVFIFFALKQIPIFNVMHVHNTHYVTSRAYLLFIINKNTTVDLLFSRSVGKNSDVDSIYYPMFSSVKGLNSRARIKNRY